MLVGKLKHLLRKLFVALHAQIRKWEKLKKESVQIKKMTTKNKINQSRRGNIIKIESEINELENKEIIEMISKVIWFI